MNNDRAIGLRVGTSRCMQTFILREAAIDSFDFSLLTLDHRKHVCSMLYR